LAAAAREAAAGVIPVAMLPGCSTGEIQRAINQGATPICLPGAVATEAGVPASPAVAGSLVTVNGCFDILHLGHVRFLAQARALGGRLTVLINDDASVRRYKGPTRPIFPLEFRRAALRALKSVDDVQAFADDTPLALLARLKPAVHVKGGTYEPDRVQAEQALLKGWGGRVAYVPLVEGHSTTDLVERSRG